MKKVLFTGILLGCLLVAAPCFAHFGMIIPSDSMVMADDSRTIELNLSFSHPFEIIGMDMVKPKSFTVIENGVAKDIRASLAKLKIMDHQAWKASYAVKRPGVYMFCMEPEPYWEPMEDCFYYSLHQNRGDRFWC